MLIQIFAFICFLEILVTTEEKNALIAWYFISTRDQLLKDKKWYKVPREMLCMDGVAIYKKIARPFPYLCSLFRRWVPKFLYFFFLFHHLSFVRTFLSLYNVPLPYFVCMCTRLLSLITSFTSHCALLKFRKKRRWQRYMNNYWLIKLLLLYESHFFPPIPRWSRESIKGIFPINSFSPSFPFFVSSRQKTEKERKNNTQLTCLPKR